MKPTARAASTVRKSNWWWKTTPPIASRLGAAKLASAGVVAVIGTYGLAVTEASQNILDEAGLVQIGTGSTSVRLTEKGLPLFFRTCPRDDAQGKSAAAAIVKGGYKAVALLHDNSSYARVWPRKPAPPWKKPV